LKYVFNSFKLILPKKKKKLKHLTLKFQKWYIYCIWQLTKALQNHRGLGSLTNFEYKILQLNLLFKPGFPKKGAIETRYSGVADKRAKKKKI